MGNESSTNNSTNKDSDYNLRLLSSEPGSPFNKKFTPYEDFITEIQGIDHLRNIDRSPITFQNSNPLMFTIYNIISQKIRVVTLIPAVPGTSNLAEAFKIKYNVEEQTRSMSMFIRVLDLHFNSPFTVAGVLSRQDFIYYCETFQYSDIDNFTDQISLETKNKDYEIDLIVYNIVSNTTKNIKVKYNPEWNGPGALGVAFGTGIAHNIRAIQRAIQAGKNQKMVLEEIPLQKQESTEIEKLDRHISNEQQSLHQEQQKEVVRVPMPNYPPSPENPRKQKNVESSELKVQIKDGKRKPPSKDRSKRNQQLVEKVKIQSVETKSASPLQPPQEKHQKVDQQIIQKISKQRPIVSNSFASKIIACGIEIQHQDLTNREVHFLVKNIDKKYVITTDQLFDMSEFK